MMRILSKALLTAVVVSLLGFGWWLASRNLVAQTPSVALTGMVTSQDGTMEGVLVTVRRTSAAFTVTVVSDAQGRYSFPETHVQTGSYSVAVRAVGYELTKPVSVDVKAGQRTNIDLTLQKASDLPSQLTSLEWVNSMPGTTEQKARLVYQAASCAYCHSLERVMKSRHTPEGFVAAIQRMRTYYPDGTASSRDGRGRAQRRPGATAPATPPAPGDLETYLASVNLGGGRTTWPYELKTLPRPAGKATRVIITQYDLPRRDTVVHDMDVAPDGTPWYTDESRMFVGKLDPKTGTFTEYPLPPVPPGDLPGARDVQVDRDGNIWFPMRVAGGQAVPTKFDPRTQQVTKLDLPTNESVQFLALGADGKVWMLVPARTEGNVIFRIDPKANKIDGAFGYNNMPPGRHGGYQLQVNSLGNPYVTDFVGSYIVGIDAKTGNSTWHPTPTRNSLPRRGTMDAQDRFWFAEYTGDRIGVLDTRTGKIDEWPVPRQYTTPYTASSPDRNGFVYSTSNMSERLLRLDPRTGDVVEYLMPTDFDAKKILHDPTSMRPTLWMANTRNARLVKVEPLE